MREGEADGNEDYVYANPLADVSAEESDGLGQSDADSDDYENRRSYLEYLSTQTQEQFARAALQRHRGAGLLRDLVENLETRALNEQRRRRRRRLPLRSRRRVLLEDSLDDFLNAPRLDNQALPVGSLIHFIVLFLEIF